MMMLRVYSASSIAALALGVTYASAQSPAAVPAATAPTIPANTCVKPEFPGKLASTARVNAFNKEIKTYGDCIRKYIEELKAIALAATAAGNSAIDEYNAYSADIKAKIEASQ
jgi:hypothetical protein